MLNSSDFTGVLDTIFYGKAQAKDREGQER
jgi:hypothetical protein